MVLPVRFGLNVDPNTGGLSIAQRITAIADAAGLELVGIQDHPYNAEFGVAGPRALRLVGAKADGWSVSAPYVPPARLPQQPARRGSRTATVIFLLVHVDPGNVRMDDIHPCLLASPDNGYGQQVQFTAKTRQYCL